MTVKELITVLQGFDPELEVMVYNRDYGFDDPWIESGEHGVVITT